MLTKVRFFLFRIPLKLDVHPREYTQSNREKKRLLVGRERLERSLLIPRPIVSQRTNPRCHLLQLQKKTASTDRADAVSVQSGRGPFLNEARHQIVDAIKSRQAAQAVAAMRHDHVKTMRQMLR